MVVEINGLELNYEMAGDGEPLLWLHGFMGAGPDWKHIFKEPPAGFRLIAPDRTRPRCIDKSIRRIFVPASRR